MGWVMRIFTIFLLLLLSQFTYAGADYAREKKWADEIIPGIVVGDPVYLELNQGHKFLGIFTEGENEKKSQTKMGLVVIHGIGIHPDWNMIGTLRIQLAESGYTTLSIQMPVLGNDANSEEYQPLFTEAAERIDVAVSFLQAKGYKKIAIVSHSMGSAMSRMYVVNNPDKLVAWASLGIGHGYSYSGIRIPVLDLYGENDLPPVLNMSKKRAVSLKGKSKSKQVRVPKSDHFYTSHEAEMVFEVTKFLGSIK
jgi:pimeloyl-ACP methyl ester carboxylesterase